MKKISFVNEQHEGNYKKMVLMFPAALENTEYQAACYVSAAPLIFDKFGGQLNEFSTPVKWFLNWQDKYLPQRDNETDEAYQERIILDVDVNYDLTSSMQQMGKLALNLWNGYEHFNLMNCLSSLDDKNISVLKTAIDVRLGFYIGQ